MKKKLALLAAAVLIVGTLAGCGDKKAAEGGDAAADAAGTESGTEQDTAETAEGGVVYLKDYKASDYVTLGEYKGLELSATLRDVTEDYMQIYMDYMRTNNPVTTEVTDRAVKDGDNLVIDYVGKIDGKLFEGGTASGQQLTIGSGQYIPGFEEGLIGTEIGKKTELQLTFPEDYSNAEVAGKAVVFYVTVQSITEQTVPELNDEYVKGLGLEEVKDVAAYKEYVKNLLTEDAQKTYEDDLENAAVDAVAASSQFQEMPVEFMDFYMNKFTDNLGQEAQMYGMTLEQYMQMMAVSGNTEFKSETSDTEGMIRELAEKGAQQSFLFAAVADAEGLNVTEEEMDERIAENAEINGFDSAEEYKAGIDTESFREYLMSEKVAKFLVDNAKVTTLKEDSAAAAGTDAEAADTDAAAEDTSAENADTEAANTETKEAE